MFFDDARDGVARARPHAHGAQPRRAGRGAALRLPGARGAAVRRRGSSRAGHAVAICEQGEPARGAEAHGARGRARHHARARSSRRRASIPARRACSRRSRTTADALRHRRRRLRRPARSAPTEIDGWPRPRARSSGAWRRASCCCPDDLPRDVAAALAAPDGRGRRPRCPTPAAVGAALPPLAARAAGGALAYVDARLPPASGAPARARALRARRACSRSTRRRGGTSSCWRRSRGERRGSLLWVLDETRDADGRAPAARLAARAAARSRPRSASASTPSRRWSTTVDARAARSRDALDGIGDLERLAGRVGARVGGPARPGRARGGARRASSARAAALARGCAAPLLARLAATLDPLPEVAAEIARDARRRAAAAHAASPGYVRAGHARRGRRAARASRVDGKGWLARFEAEERAAHRHRARSRSATTRSSATTSRSRRRTWRSCPPTTSASRRSSAPSASSPPALKDHEAQGPRRRGAPARARAAPLRGAARRRSPRTSRRWPAPPTRWRRSTSLAALAEVGASRAATSRPRLDARAGAPHPRAAAIRWSRR